ncbi:SDR family NAD(P)-dependent oxidoreductase [Paenibacillus filicis]|uniref:SDR family NAD(P)-dependent oxidoreductase n=1 Tax=Paenibacillus filicis TaxID=669464 RepID=A0ABU9DHI3_9BACL
MVNFKDVTLNRRAGEANRPSVPPQPEPRAAREIAIIGIGMDMPQASHPEAYWRMIRSGTDCIGPLPEERLKDVEPMLPLLGLSRKAAVFPEAAYLTEIDKFDYAFFRLSPKEASLMDPNQRLFLETAWKAIEDAGYGGQQLVGSRTGVFVGYGSETDYKRWVSAVDPKLLSVALAGNTRPIIASRLSYLLDLRGPSLIVDTTCSSSLLALHLACRSIREGECGMAIAGGVQLHLLPVRQTNIGVEASSFRSKSFDESADGTGTGEGVAAVLLKPLDQALKDGDSIYAVVKGSAANHDGTSIGLTAPNAAAQEDVIVSAWKDAGVKAESISYIEAHGTGTKLGDPIEVEGMQRAFGRYTKRKRFCAIGSVKTNIGHLDNSAGIAGLIKSVLALRHREIPPSLHFHEPNRKIDFTDSPVFVNDRLIPWESGPTPRRCGVSSFGLSGTNCHVILEEAPQPYAGTGSLEQPANGSDGEYHLLAVSARSVNGLRQLLEAYRTRLTDEPQLRLQDICYTANTGRGHYAYRAAILSRTCEELSERLELLAGQLGSGSVHGDEDVYYGSHQIVSANQPNRTSGELTEHEIRFMTQLAEQKLGEYIPGAGTARETLTDLAAMYVEGATPDWSKLYKGRQLRRLHLPTYPFERTRCWLERVPAQNDGAEASSLGHQGLAPLLDRRQAEALDVEVYTKRFDSRQWLLAEHRIMNESVLVGTAYLEMVLEVCGGRFPGRQVQLTNVMFQAPMVVRDEEPVDAVLVVKGSGELYEFTVESRRAGTREEQAKQSFIRHVSGSLRLLPARDHLEAKDHYPLPVLIERLQAGYMIPDLQKYNDTSVFEFGPRWNNLQGMYVGETELLSVIRTPDAFVSELAAYTLHPSLMDNALTTMPLIDQAISVNSIKDDSIFLPFAYGKLTIHSSLPAEFYSYVRLKDTITPQTELIRYDIALLDRSGKPLVEIEDYALKKARKKALQPEKDGRASFYQMAWVPEFAAETPDISAGGLQGPILVIGRRTDRTERLVELLRQRHAEVYVEAASRSGSDPDGADEQAGLLAALVKEKGVCHIVHADAYAGEPEIQEELGSRTSVQLAAVTRLFNLLQALLQSHLKHTLHLHLLSCCAYRVTGEEQALYPVHAAMHGLGKVVGSEYANIRCRSIDADLETTVEAVVQELEAEPNRTGPAAYRRGVRYIEELREQELPEPVAPAPAPARIQAGGTYVITGGAGGIGLEIAKFMATEHRVNLVLIGRTAVPDREQWEAIRAQPDLHAAKTVRAIRAVQELEASGSQVLWLAADVADRAGLSAAITETRRRFGRISGIVHAAGNPGDGFLIRKDREAFRSVFESKAGGALLLDELTQEDRPDFFVLFSSNNTLVGMPGQSDYTAANSYLDGFAASRNLRATGTVTINWPAWKETGMAADYGTNTDNLLKTISTEQALAAFQTILHADAERVIVGEIHAKGEIRGLTWDQVPIRLSDRLRRLVMGAGRMPSTATAAAAKPNGRNDCSIRSPSQAASPFRTPETIETAVTSIWRETLGFDELNSYDNFFEIGGDSILITRVHSLLDEAFPGQLTVADLFTYTSISAITEQLGALTIQAADHQEAAPSLEAADGDSDLGAGIDSLLDAFIRGEIDADQAAALFHKLGG